MTIQEFITKHNIRMKSVKVEQNPFMTDQTWNANHYEVTLTRVIPVGRYTEKKLVSYFSKGLGHKGKPPKSDEVLDSLVMDSDALYESFESWCSNFGYDTDSRNALTLYDTCKAQAAKLQEFLGNELIKELQECERL